VREGRGVGKAIFGGLQCVVVTIFYYSSLLEKVKEDRVQEEVTKGKAVSISGCG